MNKPYQKSINALSNGYEGTVPQYYEGKVPSRYSGGFNYDGEPEDVSFADEAQLSQDLTFAFTIKNSDPSAVARRIALCPAYFRLDQVALMRDNNNVTIDAIVKEGLVIGVAGTDGLTVESQNKAIDELLQFALYNPMRFVGIKMQCANPDQFYQSINIKQLSPFRNLSDKTLTPDNYKDSRQYDVTRAEIPLENFQFDNNTQITWNILPGTVVSLTLFGGAILNMAKELSKVAQGYRKGLSRSYGPDYMRNR